MDIKDFSTVDLERELVRRKALDEYCAADLLNALQKKAHVQYFSLSLADTTLVRQYRGGTLNAIEDYRICGAGMVAVIHL